MQLGRKTGARPSAASRNVAEPTEARLVSRIAEGDRYAFEILYRGYFPRLARFLDRMTRSAQLIEEVVNDTMLVVWQKAHTYDLSCKVSTWVFAIAYRKALKAIKDMDDPVEVDFELYEGDVAYEPEHEAIMKQLQRTVANVLDSLPLEQRTVVNLTYYHGMDYEEIAEIVGCPVNTVKTRMFHARRKLKILLSGQMEKS